MSDPLVGTKLLAPRLRVGAVARPRLDALLQRGTDATLTLVSAPAGFGKTTMLGVWLANRAGRPTAWVSLDARDRDATSFWSYVLAAVDGALPGAATAALAQLQSGQHPIVAVLTTLLNELSVQRADLDLVLDDYHLAESPDIQPGMTFLVEHLPPQTHLLLSSRVDPALPLSRLRARGELVEIRASDLRFTDAEAAEYLNDVHALGLDGADVAALESRTEGWAAALQLAALSLEGHDDPGRFIAGFAGDDRFVVDYLADEVLDRQPADVRRFLLDTAVLARLSGPLCDAVTGRTDGKSVLESLERQNLFVVPLDDHRQWYRYHHLFGDVLQARLLDERAEDSPDLHRRASDWFNSVGDHESAVGHALAAGDTDLAADRVELAVPVLLRDRRERVIRHWLDVLPTDVTGNRPVLGIGFIGALMASNEFAGVDERLREVETLLRAPRETLVVHDQAALARLPAAVETYKAALALVSGTLPDTVDHARRALAAALPDDRVTTASASALLGLARWTLGDLEAALQAYRDAATELEAADHIADVLGCSITIADLEVALGRLDDAQRTFEHALELTEREETPPRGISDVHVGLGRVAWERGDLERSAFHLRAADQYGETAGLPQNPYRWRVGLARLRMTEGDLASALDLLEEAERVYVGDFSPNVQPVEATRARLLVASGDRVDAQHWADGRGLSATDDLTYLREYEHVTLARILLADHGATDDRAASARAVALIGRLLAAAEEGRRVRTVVEALTLAALAEEAAGDREAALAALERAVRLAEASGFVQVISGEGTTVAGLLDALRTRHPTWSFIRTLLAGRDATSGEAPAAPDALVDPLSARELDVLRLLGSELDGPAIARQLGVSLSTVRTHTQHVYTKLAVTNRRAAVRRAHQLGLFSRAARR